MSNNYHKALPSLELLLDYLDGILDEDSTLQIESAINESEELKTIVEGIKVYYEDEGKDRAQLEIYTEQIREKFYSPSKSINDVHSNFNRIPAFWVRIAAAIGLFILAGITLIYNVMSSDLDQMVNNQVLDYYEAPLTFRGGNNTNEMVWGDVIKNYQEKDFEQTLVYLKRLPDSHDRLIMAEFYIGLCNLYKEPSDYNNAIKSLMLVSESEHRLNERAEWFLALAYYQKDDEVNAKALFQKIANENIYKSREAKKIIKLLSE